MEKRVVEKVMREEGGDGEDSGGEDSDGEVMREEGGDGEESGGEGHEGGRR